MNAMGANLMQFKGLWKNSETNTNNITKIKIRTLASDDIRVQAFGACSPHDCNWGTEQGIAYGPNVSADLMQNTKRISVVYETSFGKKTLLMRLLNPNRMQVIELVEFFDGRTNYVKNMRFTKVGAPVFLHYSSVGVKTISKVVFLQYNYHLFPNAMTKAIKLDVTKASVRIQSAVVKYSDGSSYILNDAVGLMQEGEHKTIFFPRGHVERIEITASSPNPIGSRGQLAMMAGMEN